MPEPSKLTRAEHIARHEELHQKLDELVADFITHTKKFPSKATILDLIIWSDGQTRNPTESPE